MQENYNIFNTLTEIFIMRQIYENIFHFSADLLTYQPIN